ncbi:MAG: pyrimidine/purine nucleoside phosphorylase [Solibacillus sp.]
MTSMFQNATIDKKANIYFNGNVTSRTVTLADGTKKTLGIMLPGNYTFSTSAREEMDFSAGKLRYQLEGADWATIDGAGVFEVPANSSFNLEVETVADYCCSYLEE